MSTGPTRANVVPARWSHCSYCKRDHSNASKHFSRSNHLKELRNKLAISITRPDKSGFFLWGYLKEKGFLNKPDTINDLKRNIDDEMRSISPEILSNVMRSVLDRANQCETENGKHLKNIVFKN